MTIHERTITDGIATAEQVAAEVDKIKEYGFFGLALRTAARTTPEVYEALRRLNGLLELNDATKGINPAKIR